MNLPKIILKQIKYNKVFEENWNFTRVLSQHYHSRLPRSRCAALAKCDCANELCRNFTTTSDSLPSRDEGWVSVLCVQFPPWLLLCKIISTQNGPMAGFTLRLLRERDQSSFFIGRDRKVTVWYLAGYLTFVKLCLCVWFSTACGKLEVS